MQLPLTVRNTRPGGAAKVGIPIGGRQLAMFAATIAEDLTGALGRSRAGGKSGFEPGVLVG